MLPNMFLFSSLYILLHLKNPSGTPHANWSLSQEIAQLLAETQKHGFGSLVSHLPGIFSIIKRLEQGTFRILLINFYLCLLLDIHILSLEFC
jgi:hypothetical protein